MHYTFLYIVTKQKKYKFIRNASLSEMEEVYLPFKLFTVTMDEYYILLEWEFSILFLFFVFINLSPGSPCSHK